MNRTAPRAVWPLMVALLAFLVYANSLSNGFALDDLRLVRDNPEILSTAGIPGLFGSPYWPGTPEAGLYRPVTIASFALNRGLTGEAAFGFHLGNALLHAFVCALIWYVVRATGKHYGTALATACLFAVHPIHTEAVANIAGRAELLAALGVLLAWMAHRRSRNDDGKASVGWAILAGVLYLFALLSKEVAVAAPLLFFLDDRLREDPRRNPRSGFPIPLGGVYVTAAIVGVVARMAALGGLRAPTTTIFLDNPLAFTGPVARTMTALWLQVRYAWLMIWPSALSSDYSFDSIRVVDSAGDVRFWAGLAFGASLLAAFAYGWRRSRVIALAVACWVLFFLPSSNLLFPSGTLMAERLAYLPSLGVCLVAGHVLAWLGSPERSPLRTAGSFRIAVPILLSVFLIGVSSIRTLVRNPDWRNNETLATHDVSVQPTSAKLQFGAGLAHASRGDGASAKEAFRRAVEIYPDYAQAHFNLGQLQMGDGEIEPAIAHLERATAIAPANPRPYKSLALLLERRGNHDAAIQAYADGCRLDPGDIAMRFNYGRALLAAGRTAEGQEVFRGIVVDAPRTIQGALAGAILAEGENNLEGAARIYRALLARSDLPAGIAENIRRRLGAIE